MPGTRLLHARGRQLRGRACLVVGRCQRADATPRPLAAMSIAIMSRPDCRMSYADLAHLVGRQRPKLGLAGSSLLARLTSVVTSVQRTPLRLAPCATKP
jgi:hypothetical protein